MISNHIDKGLRGGSCNRSSCLRPHAYYYNHSTLLYYCAKELNRVNRWDARDLWVMISVL